MTARPPKPPKKPSPPPPKPPKSGISGMKKIDGTENVVGTKYSRIVRKNSKGEETFALTKNKSIMGNKPK